MKLIGRLAEGQLAHAYILSGHSMDVLQTAALNLAQRVNCLDPDLEKRPCGHCSHCRRLQQGIYSDWFILEPQGASRTLRIEQIRQLQSDVGGKPLEGRMKVVLLQEAHRMNEQSQNCLLKTLEEPPENTLLLLTTDKPQGLLPTILSRCQMLSFEGAQRLPPLEDFELVEQVVKTIRQAGYEGVFDMAAFVDKNRKKKLPDFFDAFEIMLRDGMLRAFPHEAAAAKAPWAEDLGSLCLTPGGLLLEGPAGACRRGLEILWNTAYLFERNVSTTLLLENLFLEVYKLDIRSRER